MIDFYIKKGDLLPILRAELNDYYGETVTLSGASVDFNYRLRVSGASNVYRSATVEDAANGIVTYSWVSGDTATPGFYIGEFVVTFNNGKQSTFPQGKNLIFSIVEDI